MLRPVNMLVLLTVVCPALGPYLPWASRTQLSRGSSLLRTIPLEQTLGAVP